MKKIFINFILIFLSAHSVTAVAQSGGVSYRVGVGDILQVLVVGEKEFSGQFRVGSDGGVDYPYIRKIDVKGKTAEEIALALSNQLKSGYLVDPQVSVEIKEFNSQKVQVLGAVSKPGPYTLTEDTRVLDVISRAGGISAMGGKRVVLLRETPGTNPGDPKTVTPIIIDYYSLVHQGDFSQNFQLKDGDVINVPKANEIFVIGNVARPGPIKYEDNMTILQAVTLAGGTTPTASPKNTYILRQDGGKESKIEIRLDKIQDGKEKNVVLKADDVIVVPESFF